jgi:hypothetical protein
MGNNTDNNLELLFFGRRAKAPKRERVASINILVGRKGVCYNLPDAKSSQSG